MRHLLEVVQVSVGTPQVIGTHRGEEVLSSFNKQPVDTNFVTVTREGIVGDKVADTRVINGKRIHGGPDQAVCVYPFEHLAWWAEKLGREMQPGAFGENLTIRDLTETGVRIGDRFQWGEVVFVVEKARRPCSKLRMLLGEEAAGLMMESGHCGWYFGVETPGKARVDAPLVRISRGDGPTIADAFAAKVKRDPTIPDN